MPKVPPASSNGHILAEAQWLHAQGFAVVPCEGKRAIVRGWSEKRLTRGELCEAIDGTKLNIAIALNLSDLIDMECDTPEAEPKLQKLFGGKIPPTPTWQSKRGKHRLYRRPAGLPAKAKLEIDGIEFRIGNGKGALSIVPPSVHESGVRYRWLPGLSLHDVEPAELPPQIVAQLQATPAAPVVKPSTEGDIPEGKRNDTLFTKACALVGMGLPEQTILTALLDLNARLCNPPLPEPEVCSLAHSAMQSGAQGAHGSQTHAEILLEIAIRDSELWHTQDEVAYATISRAGHREHWRVRSKSFREWLAKRFYEERKTAPGSQTMQDVINVLEGKARFDGQAHPLFIRVAGQENHIYIDLTDDAWRAIEVDSSGWRIVDNPPVRFRRAKGMLPLPEPQRGGSVAELRRFVNVTDEGWPLIAGWHLAAFRPTGPYPVLKLIGEQGSAKTTTAEGLRKDVDPNVALLRRPPRSDRDLMIAANNGWIVGFDNMSYVTPELSDALCCLATGGGYATRTLYTDDEETILVAERPIILNGIEDVGTRSDLLDRCLMVELPRIEPCQRRDEEVFWREFEEARPRILGAFLDAVSVALKRLPAVKQSKTEWPRMADFAQWVVAAEGALGLKPGEFLDAYARNREVANQTALESSPVVIALLAMLKRDAVFEGTATELHNAISVGQDTRAKGWPKTPRVLSGMLARIAPNLRASGLAIEQTVVGWGNQKRKGWRIEAAEPPLESDRVIPQISDPSAPCDPAPSSLAERIQAERLRSARVARVAS